MLDGAVLQVVWCQISEYPSHALESKSLRNHIHRRIVLVLSRGVALSAAAPPTEPDGEASTDGEAFGRLGRRIRKHLKMTRREALGRRIRTPQCARRQRRH